VIWNARDARVPWVAELNRLARQAREAADAPGRSWSARQRTLHAEVLGALNYHRSDKLGRYDQHTPRMRLSTIARIVALP
jgi:hypothetical protein